MAAKKTEKNTKPAKATKTKAPAKPKTAPKPAPKGKRTEVKKAAPKSTAVAKATPGFRLTDKEKADATKKLVQLASRKSGVQIGEFTTATDLTAGKARGIIEAALENGVVRREGAHKQSTYYKND